MLTSLKRCDMLHVARGFNSFQLSIRPQIIYICNEVSVLISYSLERSNYSLVSRFILCIPRLIQLLFGQLGWGFVLTYWHAAHLAVGKFFSCFFFGLLFFFYFSFEGCLFAFLQLYELGWIQIRLRSYLRHLFLSVFYLEVNFVSEL